jgi:hypothetical protein
MAPNLQPTAILDAKGSFLKHPERQRDAEPSTADRRPLGPPSKYLSKEEKKVWKEIAHRMLPGVCFDTDRDAFELMVRLTWKMRNNQMTKTSDMQTLISLWSRFAMTPADRSRVAVEKKSEGALSKFLNSRPTSEVQ